MFEFIYEIFDKLYELNPKKLYRRYGKCNMCGNCCKNIYVRHSFEPIQTEAEFEKLKKSHDFYSYLKVIGKDEIGLIFKCDNLVEGKCKIHKKRPLICRKYPQEEIFSMGGALCKECGYKFIPKKTFDNILKNMMKHN